MVIRLLQVRIKQIDMNHKEDLVQPFVRADPSLLCRGYVLKGDGSFE